MTRYIFFYVTCFAFCGFLSLSSQGSEGSPAEHTRAKVASRIAQMKKQKAREELARKSLYRCALQVAAAGAVGTLMYALNKAIGSNQPSVNFQPYNENVNVAIPTVRMIEGWQVRVFFDLKMDEREENIRFDHTSVKVVFQPPFYKNSEIPSHIQTIGKILASEKVYSFLDSLQISDSNTECLDTEDISLVLDPIQSGAAREG